MTKLPITTAALLCAAPALAQTGVPASRGGGLSGLLGGGLPNIASVGSGKGVVDARVALTRKRTARRDYPSTIR